MRISTRTIECLVDVITGNLRKSPYRTGPQLIEFFRDFGERDLYGRGFPSRAEYVKKKLKKFNGTENLSKIIASAFDFFGKDKFDAEREAEAFSRILVRDGYRLVIEYQFTRMEGDRCVQYDPYFEVQPLIPSPVVPETLVAISHVAVNEQVTKARRRMEAGDFSGAIASSYTLTENLLKLMLEEMEVPFNKNEGDIRALYKLVRKPLSLNPGSKTIAAPLKPILDGLQKLVSGLYQISNRASDRHARLYDPALHHAKMVVNAAFTFCEFLVESRNYQIGR